MQPLTARLAEGFATIALGHVGREYPNKLDQVLAGAGDLAGPRALHPIYLRAVSTGTRPCTATGCWRGRCGGFRASAPRRRSAPGWTRRSVRRTSPANWPIWRGPGAGGFERPYGWAWLVMLQAELEAHETEEGRRWADACGRWRGPSRGAFSVGCRRPPIRSGSARTAQLGLRPGAGARLRASCRGSGLRQGAAGGRRGAGSRRTPMCGRWSRAVRISSRRR